MVIVAIMMLAGRLLMLILVSGLVLALVPTYTVSAKKCDTVFQVTISPTSETIPRGSNFQFGISATGAQCISYTHAIWGASISPNVANGPVPAPQTSYSIFINSGSGLFRGSTNSSTITGTYTITATVTGVQAPINGQSHSATATLIVT